MTRSECTGCLCGLSLALCGLLRPRWGASVLASLWNRIPTLAASRRTFGSSVLPRAAKSAELRSTAVSSLRCPGEHMRRCNNPPPTVVHRPVEPSHHTRSNPSVSFKKKWSELITRCLPGNYIACCQPTLGWKQLLEHRWATPLVLLSFGQGWRPPEVNLPSTHLHSKYGESTPFGTRSGSLWQPSVDAVLSAPCCIYVSSLSPAGNTSIFRRSPSLALYSLPITSGLAVDSIVSELAVTFAGCLLLSSQVCCEVHFGKPGLLPDIHSFQFHLAQHSTFSTFYHCFNSYPPFYSQHSSSGFASGQHYNQSPRDPWNQLIRTPSTSFTICCS